MTKRTYAKRSTKRRKTTGKKNKRITKYSVAKDNTVLSSFKLERPVFGKTFSTKMTYAQRNISVSSTLGLVSAYVFSANSLFDPDVSGTGHQPSGFDQIMPFYDVYTVTHAKIIVTFNNSDAANLQFAGVLVNDRSSWPADFAVIQENGKGTYTQLNRASCTGDMCTISQEVDIGDFVGATNVLDRDHLRGSETSNPMEQVYFILWAAPNNVTSAAAVGMAVRIEYMVTFMEPRNIPLS